MPQELLAMLRTHWWGKNNKERERQLDSVRKSQQYTELRNNRNQWSKWSMKKCFRWFQVWLIKYTQEWRQNWTIDAKNVSRKRWTSSASLTRKLTESYHWFVLMMRIQSNEKWFFVSLFERLSILSYCN